MMSVEERVGFSYSISLIDMLCLMAWLNFIILRVLVFVYIYKYSIIKFHYSIPPVLSKANLYPSIYACES